MNEKPPGMPPPGPPPPGGPCAYPRVDMYGKTIRVARLGASLRAALGERNKGCWTSVVEMSDRLGAAVRAAEALRAIEVRNIVK